jgi:hypothetical protein
MATSAFIHSEEYKVTYIWECEYRKLIGENSEMRMFVNEKLLTFFKCHPNHFTEDKIDRKSVKW